MSVVGTRRSRRNTPPLPPAWTASSSTRRVSFFFSVMISLMPMVLDPLAFISRWWWCVRAKVVRWGRFGVKFGKFFDKKNVSFFSSPSTDDRRPTKYARMVATTTTTTRMERWSAKNAAHHHAWSRRDHANNDNNDNNARSRCDCGRYFLVFTKPMCLFFVVSLFASRVVLSALLTYVFALVMRRGRYLLSQNCFSSLFRSLLFESFSLRFVDVRLYARLFFCLLLVVNTSSLWSSTPLVSLLRRFFVFVVLVFFRAVVFSSSSSSSSSFSSRSRAPPVVVAVVSSRRIVVFFHVFSVRDGRRDGPRPPGGPSSALTTFAIRPTVSSL